MKRLAILLGLIFLAAAIVPAQSEKSQVLALTKQVVGMLKRKDMSRLTSFVHPVKGVRFSPYSYVEKKDLVFKGRELTTLMSSSKIYKFGVFDESGVPIRRTFRKYYNEFVYDHDFVRAPVHYNLKMNNGVMITNVGEFYPRGIEVAYVFEGTDTEMAAGIRLIYEKFRNKYYLVGIVTNTPGI